MKIPFSLSKTYDCTPLTASSRQPKTPRICNFVIVAVSNFFPWGAWKKYFLSLSHNQDNDQTGN